MEPLKAVLFDFGGVLAEEGFREGLKAIAEKNGIDPDRFYAIADELISETGYLTGRAGEPDYWKIIRERTGITGTNEELRNEILARFVPRPEIIAYTDILRSRGYIVALLSDQTNWLQELEPSLKLVGHFDRVFNSFEYHKSKREASTFHDVCRDLGVKNGETLFIDDNINHIRRAETAGLRTIHYTGPKEFEQRICAVMRPVVPE